MITEDQKPTTKPGQEPCIRPIGQDHGPLIHLTLVDDSMDPVNEPPLWRTSFYTQLQPNIASIVQEFTFHLSPSKIRTPSKSWKKV